MNHSLRGRTALIGGASEGIGYACARALAREGARVLLVARREEKLREAAAAIAADFKADAAIYPADLADPQEVEALLDKVLAAGAVDILITNSGGPRPGGFSELAPRDWDHAYQLLLRSAVILVRGILPGMRERGWGRIIGITSVAVKEPADQLVLSSVFRTGLTALYRVVGREAAASGVTANTVLPGATETARFRQLLARTAERRGISLDEALEQRQAQLPRQRITLPDEVAEAVVWLASDAASAVNGVALSVDGGQFTGLF